MRGNLLSSDESLSLIAEHKMKKDKKNALSHEATEANFN